MSDDCDISDIKQQILLDASIADISHKASKININGDGKCLVCGNDVGVTVIGGNSVIGRWCSPECARS